MSPAYFPNSPAAYAVAAFAVIIPSYWVLSRRQTSNQTATTTTPAAKKNPFAVGDRQLQPPKDDPYTLAELAAFDGQDPNRPVYVAIKGTVFDVSAKRDVYGPGGSYSVFAGKDGSKGLGLSSLKPEDAVPDWSTLGAKERGVLNDWHAFFSKARPTTEPIGRVSDLPSNVASGGKE
ncbi:cytochrome b5 [Ceratobasidium sp. AG-Ba]|nr:cytochrome b5 [Ceratobasidium sp. AG-Ba]QRW10799.1 cytochrome b5 [Ceratobasidium sp. AG-Ba]